MTDPATSEAQRARIEALRHRRAPAAARRAHPATNARIGAAAIGVAAMFGLVAVMEVAQPATVSASASAPAPAPVSVSTPTAAAASPNPTVVTPDTAVRTVVRPRVRTVVPSTPAPTARTNGSR